MKITKIDAVQAHPVPNGIRRARGPFPQELFAGPEMAAVPEDDGEAEVLGDTAQNNFKPVKYLYCSECYERVKSTETESHQCPDPVQDDEEPIYEPYYGVDDYEDDDEWDD